MKVYNFTNNDTLYSFTGNDDVNITALLRAYPKDRRSEILSLDDKFRGWLAFNGFTEGVVDLGGEEPVTVDVADALAVIEELERVESQGYLGEIPR